MDGKNTMFVHSILDGSEKTGTVDVTVADSEGHTETFMLSAGEWKRLNKTAPIEHLGEVDEELYDRLLDLLGEMAEDLDKRQRILILQEFADDELPEMPLDIEGAAPLAEEEEEPRDTIRLDQIRKAVSQSGPDTDATAVFDAVTIEEEEQEEEYGPLEEEEFDPEVEPFSEEWEPEYDEPMGDYPTPEPIRFHHKARQKELRAKLVAGPEHLYYTLTELGVGRLRLSILLSAIVFVLSAGLTGLFTLGLIPPERLQFVIFVQFLSLLLSALLGCYRLMEGITDLVHLRFTTGSLLVFTFIVCLVDSILCLSERRIPVSAAFSLEMTMASLAVHDRRNAQIRMMDTLRRATRLDSVVCVPDFYQGCAGIGTGQGEVEHFMDHYNVPSQPENILNWYALATLGVSLAAGILGGIRHGFSTGVQLCAAAALVGMPATAFLSISRPMAILEKQLHKLGIDGIDFLSDLGKIHGLFPSFCLGISKDQIHNRGHTFSRHPSDQEAKDAVNQNCQADTHKFVGAMHLVGDPYHQAGDQNTKNEWHGNRQYILKNQIRGSQHDRPICAVDQEILSFLNIQLVPPFFGYRCRKSTVYE